MSKILETNSDLTSETTPSLNDGVESSQDHLINIRFSGNFGIYGSIYDSITLKFSSVEAAKRCHVKLMRIIRETWGD